MQSASGHQVAGYDVLPFENMSPHPDIQEERATALWKIATNAASIVIAPLNAAVMRLRSAEHYSGLARIIRRTDMLDLEELVQHLNTIGYSAVEWWRCRGNTPSVAACWMPILRKLTDRCALSCSATS